MWLHCTACRKEREDAIGSIKLLCMLGPACMVAADGVAYQLHKSFLVGEAYYPMARRQASEMAFYLALCSGCGALAGGDVDVAAYCGEGEGGVA